MHVMEPIHKFMELGKIQIIKKFIIPSSVQPRLNQFLDKFLNSVLMVLTLLMVAKNVMAQHVKLSIQDISL